MLTDTLAEPITGMVNTMFQDFEEYASRFKPRVWIGMPVRNEEAFLERSIESILNQSYSNFILYASDNNSSDGSFEILKKYANEDPRVRCVRNKKTITANENFAIVYEAGKGTCDYFMWAGGHDLLHVEYLQKLIPLLDSDKTLALAYGKTRYIDNDDQYLHSDEDDYSTDGLNKIERVLLIMSKLMSCSVFHGLIRQSFLEKVKIRYQPVFGEDHVILCSLALLGGFKQLDEMLFFRRLKHKSTENTEQFVERLNMNWNLHEKPLSLDEGRLRMLQAHFELFQNNELLTPVESVYLTLKALTILEQRFGMVTSTFREYGIEI